MEEITRPYQMGNHKYGCLLDSITTQTATFTKAILQSKIQNVFRLMEAKIRSRNLAQG